MVKRLFVLAVLCLLVCPLSSSFAQMSDEQYQAQLKAMKGELNQARNGYIQAKKEARKAAMENFFSFGKTKEEKQARKMVLEEANKKQAQLREAYKKAQDGFKNREKELKAARERHRTKEATKEMKQEKKKQQTKEATKEMKKDKERRGWRREKGPSAGPAKGRR